MLVTFENVTVTVEADTAAKAYNALCAHLERLPTLAYTTDTYSATGIDSEDTGDLRSEAAVPAPAYELIQGMFAPGQPDTLIVATITVEDVRNVAADHDWTITDEQAQAILERQRLAGAHWRDGERRRETRRRRGRVATDGLTAPRRYHPMTGRAGLPR